MNVIGVLKKRIELKKKLKALGVRKTEFYVCASPARVGFKFEIQSRDTTEHFEKRDELVRVFRKLRLKNLRAHANGVEFAVGVPWKEAALAREIVVTFKRFFFFWAVAEPFRIIESDKERAAIAKKLKYRDIQQKGSQLVVDGLESGAPGATIGNALNSLFNDGTEEELKTLMKILRS